ncbi:MAG: lipase family protein [Treponema sp.]|nr:lipase family protein [Treponema sp.]
MHHKQAFFASAIILLLCHSSALWAKDTIQKEVTAQNSLHENYSSKLIPVEFIPFGSKDSFKTQIQVEWNPDWLKESSFTYSHGIARIACLLSDISYTDITANPKDNSLIRTYQSLGVSPSCIKTFYDIDYNEPDKGNDQCAFSIAHTKDILFITIRGTPFNANEWISNMNISDATEKESSLHEGFLKATYIVQDAVKQYIKTENLDTKKIKVLVTGHSRGAAITNLLAAAFSVERTFPEEHIFAYTFASPNVTTAKNIHSKQFAFIWNIVNAEDIVPTMPPNRKGWKFSKYGNTLVLANSWNKDSLIYEEKLIPKINRIFTQIQDRVYRPFETGPFIPLQITMMLTSLSKDVDNYYNGITGIHKKGTKLLKKTDMEAVLNNDGSEGDDSFMDKISEFIRERTGGVSDYAAIAVKDMHACETYFSYLTALSQEEAFSTLGFSQIIIKGTPDGFVQDCEGNILLKFQEGRIQYSSIRLPAAARNKGFNSIVIGFPANQDFKVLLSKTSLAPTAIKATIEHYDAAGILLKTHKNQKFYADASKLYEIDAGSCSLKKDCLYAKAIKGSEKQEIVEKTGLSEEQKAKLTFEVNINTEGNFGYGVHYGPAKIYLTLLTSTNIFNCGKTVDLQPGIGTQQNITGPLFFDLEVLFKCTWFPYNRENANREERFAVIPAARASLSIMPFRRARIFAAGVIDLKIKDFNDNAFSSIVRYNTMSIYGTGDTVKMAPSLQFGIRF